MNRSLIRYILPVLLVQGCFMQKVPDTPFTRQTPPKAPAYDEPKDWACLPGRADACDTVPIDTLSDQQATARADVFFVYPTLFKDKSQWNASIADVDHRKALASTTLMHQASVFNGAAKVYVPYYRQMTLYGFWADSLNKQKALDLAYEDVKRAFLYYMKHYNQGRPFFIAGHSQGSYMAMRLINDVLPTHAEWRTRLVAAYIVGWAVPNGKITAIPVCSTASQTQCFISWNTYAWGYLPEGKYSHMPASPVGVNPLLWTTDTTYAPYTLNKGGVGRKYRNIYPAITDARLHQGYLWIHKDQLPGLAKWMNRFHAGDYNLFWMNVRTNVGVRLSAWHKKHKQ